MQYNETAVAKALVRETTAVQELDGVTLDCGEDELRQYVERLGLTGISVLDANGRLVCEYSTGQHRLYPTANRSGSRARGSP